MLRWASRTRCRRAPALATSGAPGSEYRAALSARTSSDRGDSKGYDCACIMHLCLLDLHGLQQSCRLLQVSELSPGPALLDRRWGDGGTRPQGGSRPPSGVDRGLGAMAELVAGFPGNEVGLLFRLLPRPYIRCESRPGCKGSRQSVFALHRIPVHCHFCSGTSRAGVPADSAAKLANSAFPLPPRFIADMH